MLQPYAEIYKRKEKELLQNFLEFLSFPSISAQESYRSASRGAMEWVKNWLAGLGFSIKTIETAGNPLLLAELKNSRPSAPSCLFYNHYDVQPPEPLELWISPPFQGEIRDGKIYARGAQDNKGQLFTLLAALKLYLESGSSLPFHCKLCIDGEEEIGSPGLETYLASKECDKEFFHSDYAMILDLGMKDALTPAITMSTRGLVTFDLLLKEGTIDKHSGSHGGLAYNPLRAMVELLGSLRKADGEIAIPGFYEEIRPTSLEELKSYDLHLDEEAYIQENGVAPSHQIETWLEPYRGCGFLNGCWPTLEINGISGGYGGEGFKTVIPCEARAKISCRLVANQDPAKIVRSLETFLRKELPRGIEMEFICHGQAPAWRGNLLGKGVGYLTQAIEAVWNKKPVYILEGATIPIAPLLQDAIGGQLLMFGYGLRSDQIHAPNEHFSCDRIEKGILTLVAFFQIIL